MRVLVLNAGSSTLKWAILDAGDRTVLDGGTAPWAGPGLDGRERQVEATLRGLGGFDAAGHRVVHGGARFHGPARVDDGVLDALRSLEGVDPLHLRPALAGVEALRRGHPTLPQVLSFDTAFHATLPEAAAGYGLPHEWTERWGLRRFGFHGLSVAWAAARARELLGRTPRRAVVLHLGSGCSLTALLDGRSIDTTMGFTPLEGVMMSTRSGSVDPGLLLHLQLQRGLGAAELLDALETRSGLLGVSGLSGDLREVLAAARTGQPRARLAYDRFTWSLRRAAGAMAGALGGVDTVVFTGGIGENSPQVRADVAPAFGEGALVLDRAPDGPGDRIISTAGSRTTALLVHAREELVILEEVRRLVGP